MKSEYCKNCHFNTTTMGELGAKWPFGNRCLNEALLSLDQLDRFDNNDHQYSLWLLAWDLFPSIRYSRITKRKVAKCKLKRAKVLDVTLTNKR